MPANYQAKKIAGSETPGAAHTPKPRQQSAAAKAAPVGHAEVLKKRMEAQRAKSDAAEKLADEANKLSDPPSPTPAIPTAEECAAAEAVSLAHAKERAEKRALEAQEKKDKNAKNAAANEALMFKLKADMTSRRAAIACDDENEAGTGGWESD